MPVPNLARTPPRVDDAARAVDQATRGGCSPTEGTICPVLQECEAGGFVTLAEEIVQGRQRRV
jgi:hypothetical protein